LSNMEKKCAYNKMPLTNVAFFWSGLLFASCLHNTVTHLSSDYGDYLYCSASRSHKVAQSPQHEPHSIPSPLVLWCTQQTWPIERSHGQFVPTVDRITEMLHYTALQ